MLPNESATQAMMRADPRNVGGGVAEPWRSFYGDNAITAILRDTWDLHAGMNTPKGKKQPTYPRPEMGKTTHRG